jgi:hypothetical protein
MRTMWLRSRDEQSRGWRRLRRVSTRGWRSKTRLGQDFELGLWLSNWFPTLAVLSFSGCFAYVRRRLKLSTSKIVHLSGLEHRSSWTSSHIVGRLRCRSMWEVWWLIICAGCVTPRLRCVTHGGLAGLQNGSLQSTVRRFVLLVSCLRRSGGSGQDQLESSAEILEASAPTRRKRRWELLPIWDRGTPRELFLCLN